MIDLILLGVAFVGSVLAGLIDLKTTEIPDEIPLTMAVIAIVGFAVKSFLVWSYWPVLTSIIVGLGFLGFGLFMYYTGQWGGADATMLSAIGFLVPQLPQGITIEIMFPFAVSFFFNVFLVGTLYMAIYSVILAFKDRKIWDAFVDDMKVNSALIFSVVAAAMFLILFMTSTIQQEMLKINISLITWVLGLLVFWRFARVVENVGFRKRISTKKLREGDMLGEDVKIGSKVFGSKLIEGLTKEQVKLIKKNRKHVTIKDGIRFAMAFPLALLFTIYFGDGIVLLLGLLY